MVIPFSCDDGKRAKQASLTRTCRVAGSLTNLAKCPASTVQILGAEKALFRWVIDLLPMRMPALARPREAGICLQHICACEIEHVLPIGGGGHISGSYVICQ